MVVEPDTACFAACLPLAPLGSAVLGLSRRDDKLTWNKFQSYLKGLGYSNKELSLKFENYKKTGVCVTWDRLTNLGQPPLHAR